MVYKAVNTGWNIGTFIGNPAPSMALASPGITSLTQAQRLHSCWPTIHDGQADSYVAEASIHLGYLGFRGP